MGTGYFFDLKSCLSLFSSFCHCDGVKRLKQSLSKTNNDKLFLVLTLAPCNLISASFSLLLITHYLLLITVFVARTSTLHAVRYTLICISHLASCFSLYLFFTRYSILDTIYYILFFIPSLSFSTT